jgi:cell division septal protein FtsQ
LGEVPEYERKVEKEESEARVERSDFEQGRSAIMNLILLIVVILLLFGGGGGYYAYNNWGPQGGIGIVGIVLIIIVVLFLTGRGRSKL